MADDTNSDPVLSAPESELPPTGRAVAAFAFLMVAEFFYSWSWYTVDVLRPYIRESLGLTLTQVGSGYSAQGLGAIVGAVVIGQLADRFGRRAMLATVMVGYGSALIAGVFVTSLAQYLSQRFTLGLFLGGIFPVVVGIYVGLFQPRVRGRIAALINGTASLAIVAQGLAAGTLVDYDWRLLLWVGGLPPILLALFGFFIIPRSVDTRGARTTGARLPLFELFGPGLARQTVMLATLTGLNFFAYQAFNGWLTTFLKDVQHLDATSIGRVVAAVSAANIVGGLLWGWAGDSFGRRFNALGFFAAAILIAIFLAVPPSVTVFAIIGILYGLAFSSSVIWGPWITELYPPHLKSTAASIFNWGRIVSIFAPIITGGLAERIGLGHTMALGSVIFAIAGFLWLALPETHQRPLLPGGRANPSS
jgi:MFS family permease